jgi:hypothetical protein
VESNRRNHYRTLHVQPEAPEAVIRASYRTIMQRLRAHPDLGGDHRVAAQINEAYAVLTDPARRAAYDAELGLRHPRRPGTAPETVQAREPARPRDAPQRAAAATCAFCGKPDGRSLRPDSLCMVCGSPLLPVGTGTPPTPGRAQPRVERNHRAHLYTHWPQARGVPAEMLDLSPLGVRLLSQAPLAAGSVVRLDSDVCRAVLRIARAQQNPIDGRCVVGAAFVTVLFSEPRGGFVSLRA